MNVLEKLANLLAEELRSVPHSRMQARARVEIRQLMYDHAADLLTAGTWAATVGAPMIPPGSDISEAIKRLTTDDA